MSATHTGTLKLVEHPPVVIEHEELEAIIRELAGIAEFSNRVHPGWDTDESFTFTKLMDVRRQLLRAAGFPDEAYVALPRQDGAVIDREMELEFARADELCREYAATLGAGNA